MKTSEKLKIKMKAFEASRNIHCDFSQYLCGEITFNEFIAICRKRETEFESLMKDDERKEEVKW